MISISWKEIIWMVFWVVMSNFELMTNFKTFLFPTYKRIVFQFSEDHPKTKAWVSFAAEYLMYAMYMTFWLIDLKFRVFSDRAPYRVYNLSSIIAFADFSPRQKQQRRHRPRCYNVLGMWFPVHCSTGFVGKYVQMRMKENWDYLDIARKRY